MAALVCFLVTVCKHSAASVTAHVSCGMLCFNSQTILQLVLLSGWNYMSYSLKIEIVLLKIYE